MAKYILNSNMQDSKSGSNYEVHNEETCTHLPYSYHRLPIGYYSNCFDAVTAAKLKYSNMAHAIDGCFYCAKACNHG